MSEQHNLKQKYTTKDEAEASILQQRYFYNPDRELGVYKCHECNFWHITSK